MIPVFVVAALAAPVAAAVAAVGLAVRRSEGEYSMVLAIRDWACSHELAFLPEWSTLALTLQAHVPGITRAWAGFRGVLGGSDVFGATCTWEINHGRHHSLHRRDVRGVRIPGAHFPMLVVHRRHRAFVMRPRLNSAGLLDVEHAAFSRRWDASCPSARLAHDLLHPRVVEALMEAPRWVDAVWFHDDAVLLAGRGGTPERTKEALVLLAGVAALVPTFTIEELAQDADGSLYGPVRRGITAPLPWQGTA